MIYIFYDLYNDELIEAEKGTVYFFLYKEFTEFYINLGEL